MQNFIKIRVGFFGICWTLCVKSYSVKTKQHHGGETPWARNVQGRTDEGAKRP